MTKPIALAAKLDDADFLAQVEAVDRFTANMIAYPGRTFGQLYHRLLKGNQLASGSVTMDDREIRLADITAPLLAFGGAGDGIAPVGCVRPIVDLVTGVDDLRFEIVPGGHLGMLTGRAARGTTWRIIDEWIDAHSSAAADRRHARGPHAVRLDPEDRGRRRRPRPRRPRKAPARATAKKAAAKRKPAAGKASKASTSADRREPVPPLRLGRQPDPGAEEALR